MKILIVSATFPPFSIVGALRVGKTAKYLSRLGHDVRVLATRDHSAAETLPVEFPPERVHWTKCVMLGRPGELVQGGRGRVLARGRREGALWNVLRRIWKLYRVFVYVPDAYITWYPSAVREGRRLVATWRPDVILASAPPATGFLVAHALSRASGIPWVAEFRDLWVDDPQYDYRGLRRRIDRRLEAAMLRSASGHVVATSLFIDLLRPKTAAPIEVVYNSLDPEDRPAPADAPAQGAVLRLVFTGAAKIDVCDYDALFEAFSRLGADADAVRLVFIGLHSGAIIEKARAHGVEHMVEAHLPVAYADALRAQVTADVLLLMTYVGDVGFRYIPAKFFEYIFTRRPILLVGPREGEVANVVRQHALGFVSRDPSAIADRLRIWIDEKRRTGSIAPLPEAAIGEFTRPRQVARLAAFLERIVEASR